MKRCLIRTTLLVYVGYVVLLTALAYNPNTDTSSRGLIALALILFILWMGSSGTSPAYTAYIW
ncbi:MAG: hypothetical protein H0X30_19115 [Anaerolineae bacterium]|nr:hypothetical protein [Anaerolineae bacterium]